MRIKPLILLAILTLLCASCTKKQTPFFDLSDKAVPKYTIHSFEDFSIEGYVNFTYEVIVGNATEFELISKDIINKTKPHQGLVIFFFKEAPQSPKDKPFGKCWWGSEAPEIPALGDYNSHVIIIDFFDNRTSDS